MRSFKVEGKGELQFLGDTQTGSTFDVQEVNPTMISFRSNNKYAYETGCGQDALNPAAEAFKRETSGTLQFVPARHEMPKAKSASYVYCPDVLATGPRGELAFAVSAFDVNQGESVGAIQLAASTADSEGNLITKSTNACWQSNLQAKGCRKAKSSGSRCFS